MTQESEIGTKIYEYLNKPDNTNKTIKYIKDEYMAWKKLPPKARFKDIIFTVSCVSLWMFMLWVMKSEYAMARPYVQFPDGLKVYGNCTFIYDLYHSQQNNGIELAEKERKELLQNASLDLIILDKYLPGTVFSGYIAM